MPSKAEIAHIRTLHHRRSRTEEGLFLVEGTKCVGEALAAGLRPMGLYTTEDGLFEAESPEVVGHAAMERMSAFDAPSPVLGVFALPTALAAVPKTVQPMLAVEDLNNPGNLGTLIRLADWFGLGAVLVTPKTTDPYGPKCVQASMGSIFRVPIVMASLPELFASGLESGHTHVGASLEGTDVRDFTWPTSTILWIGSESHGLSEAALGALASKVSIPAFGSAESLNATMAAAVLVGQMRLSQGGKA